jgi:hypothetical protein
LIFFLFTQVKIIKNILRTTIGQNRLESLMLLSCKDISFNLEKALDIMGKSRKLYIVWWAMGEEGVLLVLLVGHCINNLLKV